MEQAMEPIPNCVMAAPLAAWKERQILRGFSLEAVTLAIMTYIAEIVLDKGEPQ